ncbi:aspartyl-phosphate phosphatase Spo0E family protein [Paenibacillus sp. FSL W7-1287]|uniref:aspartyl-phosphate phosphatase Spo0E family protein n=1 Tax=Paenibacillus sp. FSL W7-1287 TaxID=2954538 RepID=UPI0030FBBF04
MNDLLSELERERRKLNELGQALIEQSIPLCSSKELQLQSRRVDELLIKLHHLISREHNT